ncbi:MAG: hypothetical protein JO131_04415, partial [Gammaproteobacteria bacterium]|nr:hypothetical protein [Gammaproteobacteria bacterium]
MQSFLTPIITNDFSNSPQPLKKAETTPPSEIKTVLSSLQESPKKDQKINMSNAISSDEKDELLPLKYHESLKKEYNSFENKNEEKHISR